MRLRKRRTSSTIHLAYKAKTSPEGEVFARVEIRLLALCGLALGGLLCGLLRRLLSGLALCGLLSGLLLCCHRSCELL